MKAGIGLLLFFGAMSGAVAVAHAQTPAAAVFQGALRIGRPSREVPVIVANTSEGAEVTIGTTRHVLPGTSARAATTENLPLTSGASLGLIVLGAAQGDHTVLVGSRRGNVDVIYSNYNGLRGDPGERVGNALVRSAGNARGQVELQVVEYRETVRDCGGQLVPLRATQLDPRTLQFRAPTRVAEVQSLAADATPLAATTAPPASMPSRPRVQLLRARWTEFGSDATPLAEMANGGPFVDGKDTPNTGKAPPGGYRSVLQVTHDVEARALTFTTSGGGGGAPIDLRWRGNTGGQFHVTLPGGRDPARHWVALPAGLRLTCLDLVTDDPDARLTEIELFTELDTPGGLETQVARVITDDRHGTEAAGLLVSLGDAGIQALHAAWDRLGPRGQRRVVIALQHSARTSALARQVLAAAAGSRDADIADRAVRALLAAPDASVTELAGLAQGDGAVAERAIAGLGLTNHPSAIAALLPLATSPRRQARTTARRVLPLAVARLGETAVGPLTAWFEHADRIASVATLRAAAAHPATQAIALSVWQRIHAEPLEFEELWGAIDGARDLAASAEVDAWLAALAVQDERWMVRDAALNALAHRSQAAALPVAQGRLDDAYPRVRVSAFKVAAQDPGALSMLVSRFGTEEWPMVRSTIVGLLPPGDDSRAIRVAALDDDATQVRIAAILASQHHADASVWPAVRDRLRDDNEWPAVMSAAIQFAGAMCIESATNDLKRVLERGLKPDAWAPDVDLAMEAIEVLGHLGTPDARALLQRAQAPEQPQAIREQAARAIEHHPCASGDHAPVSTQRRRPVERILAAQTGSN